MTFQAASDLQAQAAGRVQKLVISRAHARLIRLAGVVIILLSAGAALLPVLGSVPGTFAIGVFLVMAGLVELFAGALRHETRTLAMLAGAATAVAGALFVFNPDRDLLSNISVVSGWLLLRSLILVTTSRCAHGSVKMWLGLSAATDFVLGVVLLTGLSISSLVITFFGPLPEVIAAFAWVLALSFVITGTMLLEVASCEQEPLPGVPSCVRATYVHVLISGHGHD